MTDNAEALQFLDQNGIKYQQDGARITVPGDLDLSKRELTALPDLSQVIVEGSFYCHENKLTSLKGSPKTVGANYECDRNMLTSLVGCPTIVKGNFHCQHNNLSSLTGGPKTVGGNYFCLGNPLTSYDGMPRVLKGHISRPPLASDWVNPSTTDRGR